MRQWEILVDTAAMEWYAKMKMFSVLFYNANRHPGGCSNFTTLIGEAVFSEINWAHLACFYIWTVYNLVL